jgi:hypothetical protein
VSEPGAVQASQNLPAQRVWTSIVLMSAPPEEHGGSHDVIHLGGETAVVIPLDEYRMFAALRDRASADEIEEAEIRRHRRARGVEGSWAA